MENYNLVKFCVCCLVLLSPVRTFAWSTNVIGVADGDTILVLQEDCHLKVNLYGIDAPEEHQTYGKQAQKFISDMITEKDVEIEEIAGCTDDQIVALVRVDGKNVSEELIRSGYAWFDVDSCDQPFCQQWQSLEEEAKRDQKGLWRDKNPVPPWEWRKNAPQNMIANFFKYIWMVFAHGSPR